MNTEFLEELILHQDQFSKKLHPWSVAFEIVFISSCELKYHQIVTRSLFKVNVRVYSPGKYIQVRKQYLSHLVQYYQW